MLSLLLFSCQVVLDSSCLYGLQHPRPPCPSPSPRVCPRSYSLHQWCCPTISSSNALFSFCSQSFPASGTLLTSHLFSSDDQNSGASASASVLPVTIQGWSPLRLTGLISLLPRDFQNSSPAPQFEGMNSLVFCLLYSPGFEYKWFIWEIRYNWASLVAQVIKNPPAIQKTRVQSLGQEDHLEKEMATHSSLLAWKILRTEEPSGLQSMGSQGVRHDWVTKQQI